MRWLPPAASCFKGKGKGQLLLPGQSIIGLPYLFMSLILVTLSVSLLGIRLINHFIINATTLQKNIFGIFWAVAGTGNSNIFFVLHLCKHPCESVLYWLIYTIHDGLRCSNESTHVLKRIRSLPKEHKRMLWKRPFLPLWTSRPGVGVRSSSSTWS